MSENGSDIERKLMSVLSDPSAMASIMSLVKGLGAGSGDAPSTHEPANTKADESAVSAGAFAPLLQNQKNTAAEDALAALPAIAGIKHHDDGINRSLNLLCAIKPFLNNERSEKLEMITQILKVLSLTDIFK